MKYNAEQIAQELRATAAGKAHYGNALLVALDIPAIMGAPLQKAAIQRYLRGTQLSTDHIRLQEAAQLINP